MRQTYIHRISSKSLQHRTGVFELEHCVCVCVFASASDEDSAFTPLLDDDFAFASAEGSAFIPLGKSALDWTPGGLPTVLPPVRLAVVGFLVSEEEQKGIFACPSVLAQAPLRLL